MPITDLFINFIKGLTYFSNELSDARPIYHRLYSCGPYEDSHRQGNLICTAHLTKKEISRRRTLIERCYIERLIYNELWQKEASTQEASQDQGHMFRLDLTKQDFETCFPGTVISVKLEYNDNMPAMLIMKKVVGGETTKIVYKKNITITSYGHRLYEDLVECTKEVMNVAGIKKTFFKVSTFDRRNKFTQVS